MEYINYGKNQILGSDALAEGLYEWSLKNKVGTSYTKKLPFGLEVTAMADGEEPKVMFKFSQAKFNNFLKYCGNPQEIALNCYGVNVFYFKGDTTIRILDDSDEGIVLYDSTLGPQDGLDIFCISLLENGPHYSMPDEYRARPLEVKANKVRLTNDLKQVRELNSLILITKNKLKELTNER